MTGARGLAQLPLPDWPLVSVAVVAYSQERYIEQALESAIAQDYPALQIVVADDCSQDGTAELIQEFARAHPDVVTAVIGETRAGVTGNGNRALKACRGELLTFMGGDDVLLPGKVATQVEWFKDHPLGVVCGHRVEVIDADGRILGVEPKSPVPGGRGPTAVIQRGGLYPTPTLMLRADAVPHDGLDTRLGLVSDWKLVIDCLATTGGEYGALDGVYSQYRRAQGSVSHQRLTDPHVRTTFLVDALVTLAIVAGERPENLPACRRMLATLFYDAALWHLDMEEVETARGLVAAALRADLRKLPRVCGLAAVAALPRSGRHRALAYINRRARRRLA